MRLGKLVRLASYAAAAAMLSAGAAQAQICNAHYPTRATGAACYGSNATAHITRPHDGVVVCCVRPPQTSSGTTAYRVAPQQNRYAAGLAAAGLGLSLFLEAWQLFESAEAESSEEDYQAELRARIEGERLDARRTAAAWNYSGLQAARNEDFVSADAHLSAAIKYAIAANDDELEERYTRNRDIVRAQWYLKEGLALKAEGDLEGAQKFLLRASHAAYDADSKDLEQRILAYRRDLHASSPKLRKQPFRERSSCVIVNGEQLCD